MTQNKTLRKRVCIDVDSLWLDAQTKIHSLPLVRGAIASSFVRSNLFYELLELLADAMVKALVGFQSSS
ncbi:MAG: hypothetical protein F4W92_09485 [Gammaproteobacteria bacterium]|nr:hypothetical protein [Gammaproteobacteria bacterium]